MFTKTLIASVLAYSQVSARYMWGSCPSDVAHVSPIDMDKLSGTWYEVEKDAGFPMTIGAECTFQRYGKNANGNHDLWYGAYQTMMWMGYQGVRGEVICKDGADCEQTMPDFEKKSDDNKKKDKEAEFNVLDTDYENYMIQYFCWETWMGTMDYIIISSREKTLSLENLRKARNVIRAKVPSYNYDW